MKGMAARPREMQIATSRSSVCRPGHCVLQRVGRGGRKQEEGRGARRGTGLHPNAAPKESRPHALLCVTDRLRPTRPGMAAAAVAAGGIVCVTAATWAVTRPSGRRLPGAHTAPPS